VVVAVCVGQLLTGCVRSSLVPRSLQAVMDKMEENMSDLNSLQQKVGSKHESDQKTRDEALRSKPWIAVFLCLYAPKTGLIQH